MKWSKNVAPFMAFEDVILRADKLRSKLEVRKKLDDIRQGERTRYMEAKFGACREGGGNSAGRVWRAGCYGRDTVPSLSFGAGGGGGGGGGRLPNLEPLPLVPPHPPVRFAAVVLLVRSIPGVECDQI